MEKARMQKFAKKVTPTIAYNLKTNGQVENYNKQVKLILAKIMTQHKKDLDQKSPTTTWAYNTTLKVTTNFTLFKLIYGEESVLQTNMKYMHTL